MTQNNMIYVVYPYAEGRYNAVKVNEKVGTISIHQAIAAFENDASRSRRDWKSPIEAGSFNIMKISNAETAAEAMHLAEIRGLKYEPKPIVLNRYRSSLSKASTAFTDIGGQGPKVYGGTGIDPKFRSELDNIFGDFMRKGPKR